MKNKTLAAASLLILSAACMAASAPTPGDADTQAVGATIAAFGTALEAGDLDRVAALLDPGVVILESGGAERSRDEYLASHAKADAAFMKDARVRDRKTDIQVAGDAAWAMTTSVVDYEREGKPRAVDAAETMVLRRAPDGWRIVHIHWSSHARSAP